MNNNGKMKKLSFFIIGMPRSGTKLFRELLNNHNEIFIPGIETHFIPYFLKKYSGKKFNTLEVDSIIEELKQTSFFFYYLKSKQFNFEKLRADQITIKEFIDRFFNELAIQEDKNSTILGDKTPNYIFHFNELVKFYPDAKFIHIVRDSRDYSLSMRKTWNKNIYRAAYKWERAMDKVNKIKPGGKVHILEIKYEDLISTPKEILEQVCAFLEIDFYDEMIELDHQVEYLGDARAARISSDNSQKYLSEMSEKEIKRIEQLTFEYLKSYGYPVSDEIVPVNNVSSLRKASWRLTDIYNLILFNVKTHGFRNGMEKIIKVNKFS